VGWAFTGVPNKILHYTGSSADLSPSRKVVDQIYAAPGARLTYTITASNAGPCDAGGVEVTDAVPANTSYVEGSATTSQGTLYEPTASEPLRVEVGQWLAGRGDDHLPGGRGDTASPVGSCPT